jgi:pimeloyl-ACP methyl ester carboxylesterase
VIATGYGAIPHNYFSLADELARTGRTVLIPDLNTPLRDEHGILPTRYRCDRIRQCVEDLMESRAVNIFSGGGHSYGGPSIAGLLEDAPAEVESIDFINSLGYGALNTSAVELLRKAIGFYIHEARIVASHPRNFLGATALREQLRVAYDVPTRWSELSEIRAMVDFLVPYITLSETSDVRVRHFISLLDHVVDPLPTLQHAQNVVSIHARANHFAPNVYGEHVAHLLDVA